MSRLEPYPKRWVEVPPSHFAPRLILVYYSVMNPPFTPRVRPPGTTLTLVVDGVMGFLTPSGVAGKARRGDVVCFYPGITEYQVAEDRSLAKYSVYFQAGPGALAEGVPALPGHGRLPETLSVGDELEAFVKTYESLLATMMEFRPTWELEAAATITRLVGMLFGLAVGQNAGERGDWDRWDRLAARLTEENEPAAISQLAQDFSLGTEHFIREFARRFGKTPKQYILDRHLWRARRLLQQGHRVKEAASRTGFDNLPHFSRLYRKRFGCPPSATPAKEDAILPPDTALPWCRHFFAPGIGYGDFQA